MSSLRRSARLRRMISASSLSSLTSPEDSDTPLEERKRRVARKSNVELCIGDCVSDASTLQRQTKKRKTAMKGSNVTSEDEFVPEKKARKKLAPEPETLYVIPDVERKKQRLEGGLVCYACLNTVLRSRKPTKEAIFCSRTCRLDSLVKNGIDWVKELGRRNVQDLIAIIEWNEQNNIRFFRISSDMFPYASHGIYGYSLEYCAPLLARAGELANKYGHRLTTHPGQFTQLGSPKPGVIEAAVRELAYQCEMLDRMGMGPDGVMVVHGGGVYGDKSAAIERMKYTIREILPSHVRNRLVLENDELCYNAEDLLPVCEELDVPLVFDYHHDKLNPSSIPPRTIIQRAHNIWRRRGIRPKQHLSEPRPGAVTLMEKRAHADLCESLPPDLPDDIDLMIEAKDKEQAVLHLYRIYGLQPVMHSSLRPPDMHPTKETKGRKARVKSAGVPTAENFESGVFVGQDEVGGPLSGSLRVGDGSIPQ